MNKTQKGFALVEGLLILIIVLLVGFIGYYVWHSQKQTDNNNSNSLAASQNAPMASKSVSKAATAPTGTELIAAAIADKCHANDPSLDASKIKTTNLDLFRTNGASLQLSGNYASANGTCGESAQPGTAVGFLFKKTNGSWTFVYMGQQVTDCEAVDNQGWPASILPDCYDSAAQSNRAPK